MLIQFFKQFSNNPMKTCNVRSNVAPVSWMTKDPVIKVNDQTTVLVIEQVN